MLWKATALNRSYSVEQVYMGTITSPNSVEAFRASVAEGGEGGILLLTS